MPRQQVPTGGGHLDRLQVGAANVERRGDSLKVPVESIISARMRARTLASTSFDAQRTKGAKGSLSHDHDKATCL